MTTPFGGPVVPEVYTSVAGSSGLTRRHSRSKPSRSRESTSPPLEVRSAHDETQSYPAKSAASSISTTRSRAGRSARTFSMRSTNVRPSTMAARASQWPAM